MWVTSLWRVLPITLSSQADIPSLTNVVLVERYTFRRLESTHVKSPSSSSSSCLDITPALQQFIHFIVSFTRNSSSPSRTQDTSSNTIISKDNPASPSYFSKQVHAWKHVKQLAFPDCQESVKIMKQLSIPQRMNTHIIAFARGRTKKEKPHLSFQCNAPFPAFALYRRIQPFLNAILLGCADLALVSEGRSEPRFDDQFGWLISISSRKAINVSEVKERNGCDV